MEIKMESNLIKQLEDKKKELLDIEQGIKILEMSECSKDSNCHEYSDLINEKEYYRHCKEIIAILEQAIAEMQKQRQEILDIYNKISELQRRANFFYLDEKDLTNKKYERGQYDAYHNVLRLFEKQLNQPKTEQ
jgi:hypothetical protein